jgi:hypothetical protein
LQDSNSHLQSDKWHLQDSKFRLQDGISHQRGKKCRMTGVKSSYPVPPAGVHEDELA